MRNQRKGLLTLSLVRFPSAQASIHCPPPPCVIACDAVLPAQSELCEMPLSVVHIPEILVTPPVEARKVTRPLKPDSNLLGAELLRSTRPQKPLPPHARAPVGATFLLSEYHADPLVPHHDCFFFRAHIRGHEAHAISDTGATENFISADLAKFLGLELHQSFDHTDRGLLCEDLYTLCSRISTYWYMALEYVICGSSHRDSPGVWYAILCAF